MEILQQEKKEILAAYYQRSLYFFKKAKEKDKHKSQSVAKLSIYLSEFEEFILGLVVNAFVKRLKNFELIRKAISKDASVYRNIQKAYKLVLESQRFLEVIRQLDLRIKKKKQLKQNIEIQNQQVQKIDKLRCLVYSQLGLLSSIPVFQILIEIAGYRSQSQYQQPQTYQYAFRVNFQLSIPIYSASIQQAPLHRSIYSQKLNYTNYQISAIRYNA